jgi:hypothetical protein
MVDDLFVNSEDACGDFINLKICPLSPSEMLIGIGCAFVYSQG